MTATQVKLVQAKEEARALLRSGDYAKALRAFDGILAAMPLDYDVRFRIGDVLAKVGLTEEAAQVYRTVAEHDIKSGHPLPAVVAYHLLTEMGKPAEDLLTQLAQTYASGSPLLARFAVRPAPVDPETPLEIPPVRDNEPFDQIADRARQRAVDLSAFVTYQQQFHPLPFLSDLRPEALIAVLKSLKIRRFEDGALVVKQGDAGESLYLVAAGELRVFVRQADGKDKELAQLFENTLFGEMALLANQPRAASVAVVGEADLIEVSRDALARVTAFLPVVKEVLDRFARERLIKNLLATSPLFAPFTKAQQAELLKRFEGLEVEIGTEVIREQEAGRGLFVVLGGDLEASSNATGSPVVLGKLGAGDIFGEMSLLTNHVTSATVKAVTPCTLLFLARGYVERLASAIPEVHAYFARVAEQRSRDNTVKLSAAALPTDIMELDPSDAILL